MSDKFATYKIGDKEYKVSSYRLGMTAASTQYIRELKLASFLTTAGTLDNEARSRIICDILRDPIDIEQRSAWLCTLSGSYFIIWQALKRYQPELTLHNIYDIVDYEDFDNLMSIINGLSKTDNDSKNATGAEAAKS